VDFLKIDGQFVRNAHRDAVDRATVRCIQEVARVVGKRTIAECVESPEALALMREMGVDFAQGYAIHRPEPLDAALGGVAAAG
jgi:EAL domain-containing protein (putative c-di-GMP-specific phosphodiesterase class I)